MSAAVRLHNEGDVVEGHRMRRRVADDVPESAAAWHSVAHKSLFPTEEGEVFLRVESALLLCRVLPVALPVFADIVCIFAELQQPDELGRVKAALSLFVVHPVAEIILTEPVECEDRIIEEVVLAQVHIIGESFDKVHKFAVIPALLSAREHLTVDHMDIGRVRLRH